MTTEASIPTPTFPAQQVGLPDYLADDGGRSPAEHMRFMVDMAKKLTAKSPERVTDAARALIFIQDNGLHVKKYRTFKAFLEAESLAKATAYTTMAAVRRFPLETIFEIGLTKARALARVPDAETLIADGFDYLAEDGSIQHMMVLGTSTRPFQDALKARRLPAAATSEAPAGNQAEAADAAIESEASAQVAESNVAPRVPDPASPPSLVTIPDPATLGEPGEDSVGADTAPPPGETGLKEAQPATVPADNPTAESLAVGGIEHSAAGGEEFDLEPNAVDVGDDPTSEGKFGPASQPHDCTGDGLPDRPTQDDTQKPVSAARLTKAERKAARKALKAGGQARATGAGTPAKLPETDRFVAAR